jgi:hypothetical protein
LSSFVSKATPELTALLKRLTAHVVVSIRLLVPGPALGWAIEKSVNRHVEFRVKEKKSETTAIGKLDVKEGGASPVSAFSLRNKSA